MNGNGVMGAAGAKADMRGAPEPWDYNPSKWSQRVTISILAFGAFLISVYLGLYQWGLIAGVWDPVFGGGSQRVLDSDVSHAMKRWFRMPDAILGAMAYLGDVVFAMAGSVRRWQFRPWLVIVFGLDVIPLGIVSAILVFMQGWVVGSWCFLCLVTAFFLVAKTRPILRIFRNPFQEICLIANAGKIEHSSQRTGNTFSG